MESAPALRPDTLTRFLAWTTMGSLAILLGLGTLITTYRVGMVDPIWPTEPWFLLSNWQEPSAGYLIEHIHRVAGYVSGLVILAMVLSAWRSAPAIIGAIPLVLVSGCLAFAMTSINREMARTDPIGAVNPVRFYGGLVLAFLSFLVPGLAWLTGKDGHATGRSLRLAALLTYGAVIIQGLLGGFRVYLNALMGDTLATIHGAFGQCVLALASATLTLSVMDCLRFSPSESPRKAARFFGLLVAVTLLQLAWAVVVRHQGAGWAQRLHVIFAVIIAGGLGQATMLCREQDARHLRVFAIILTAALVLQVTLGVEAWLGKFGTGKPLVPEARTAGEALLRTGHSLIGAAYLALSVAAWIRAWRPAALLAGPMPAGGFQ